MRIRKNGIYKNVPSSEFGLWQSMGFEKVVEKPLPKLEDAKVEPVIEDEPIAEVVDEEPIKEVAQSIDEIVDEMPKSKKNRRK